MALFSFGSKKAKPTQRKRAMADAQPAFAGGDAAFDERQAAHDEMRQYQGNTDAYFQQPPQHGYVPPQSYAPQGHALAAAHDPHAPPETGEGLLTAYNIQKAYKGRKVVKGVSLGVGRGESVGLLGPNGAGKTTSFYMITGLVAADAGSITIDGRDVTRLPMYRRARLGIGYLPQ
jgi:ABC-type glutathione transport system ATPase component